MYLIFCALLSSSEESGLNAASETGCKLDNTYSSAREEWFAQSEKLADTSLMLYSCNLKTIKLILSSGKAHVHRSAFVCG